MGDISFEGGQKKLLDGVVPSSPTMGDPVLYSYYTGKNVSQLLGLTLIS